MMNQTIFLGGSIYDSVAEIVVFQMLFLEFQKLLDLIHLYLNCTGGEVPATMTIYDMMQTIKASISTICV